MAEILFVSGSYFPNATANAVCVKKFEDELKRRGHKVGYCNRKHDLYEADRFTVDGTVIDTVGKNSDLLFQTMEKLSRLDLPCRMGTAFRMATLCCRGFTKLLNPFCSGTSLREKAHDHYIKRYARRICEIVGERKVDLIVSVSMPFDSHLAVLEATKNLKAAGAGVPLWIAYNIDISWSKAGIPPELSRALKERELEIFATCDHILDLDVIAGDYAGGEYDPFRSKMSALPLPVLDIKEQPVYDDGIEVSGHGHDFVFAGTIYDDLRDLDGSLAALDTVADLPWTAHFMGKIYPGAMAKLNNFRSRHPEKIEIYGRMPYPFAKGSMQRADVLINLANDCSNQIPSKIFEYMLALKPILNIYRKEDDVGTAYLKRYPLAFNYRSSQPSPEQDSALRKWLLTLGERKTTLAELETIYRDVTTKTVADRFCRLVEELLRKR